MKEVKYFKVFRGPATFFGMAIKDDDFDIKVLLLYEEGCYQKEPIVINSTVKDILSIQIEHAYGEEISELEWYKLMSEHASLILENTPTEEDIK